MRLLETTTPTKPHLPKESEFRLILAAWEGQFIEFKASVSENLDREIVAFANSGGGKIFIGVADDKKVVGIQIDNRLVSRVHDMARNCDPPIHLNVDSFRYRKSMLLLVAVSEGDRKPYSCSKGYFFRSGANSQKMNRDELLRFVRGQGDVRFDEIISKEFSFPRDFSPTAFRKFLGEAEISSRGIKREDLLMNLGLAKLEHRRLALNNVGVLFFAKYPKRFHIQSRISCLLFQGTNKETILDRKDFEGGLLENVHGAMTFFGQHIPLQYRIEKLKREEISALPETAMREALLNAVIHRDYFERGGSVMVEIYRDRVEITNPGGLVPGFRLEELGRFSLPRNPLLADLFFRLGYVEKVGTGIGRIRTAMAKVGLSEPIFESGLFFTVKFQLPIERLGASTGTKSALSGHQVTVLMLCKTPRALVEIMKSLGRTDRTKFRNVVLKPLLTAGYMALTVKDRPKSRLQKYVTTEKGLEAMGAP